MTATHGRTRRRTLLLALLACTFPVLTACSSIGVDLDRTQRAAELADRPSLGEAVARQDAMLTEIRNRLSGEVGPLTWTVGRPGSGAGCGADYPPDSDGQTASSPQWLADANVPDDRWPQAQEIVGEISGRYGFDPLSTLLDRPGDHRVFAYDPHGAYLSFGTNVNTVLRANSACHLPLADRP